MWKTLRGYSLVAGAALSGATLLAGNTPARAQSTVEELTVTGRYGTVPDNVRSISQTVSYADLDLGSRAGQQAFKHRIALTARYLCDKLGESDTSDGVTPSCRDDATSNAYEQADAVIAHFSPRSPTWVAREAWTPPYPNAWEEKYP